MGSLAAYCFVLLGYLAKMENYTYDENESCEPVVLWIDLFL